MLVIIVDNNNKYLTICLKPILQYFFYKNILKYNSGKLFYINNIINISKQILLNIYSLENKFNLFLIL